VPTPEIADADRVWSDRSCALAGMRCCSRSSVVSPPRLAGLLRCLTQAVRLRRPDISYTHCWVRVPVPTRFALTARPTLSAAINPTQFQRSASIGLQLSTCNFLRRFVTPAPPLPVFIHRTSAGRLSDLSVNNPSHLSHEPRRFRLDSTLARSSSSTPGLISDYAAASPRHRSTSDTYRTFTCLPQHRSFAR
jgi:hypothetical protein